MKMVQTQVTLTDMGWKVLAACPICGKLVFLGITPHKDEACSELPVTELVDLCYQTMFTEKQAVAHTKAEWANEHGDISPEDYVR